MKSEDRQLANAAPVGRGSSTPPRVQDFHLQPEESDGFALTEFEGLNQATTLARLSGDLELVNELRLNGFDRKDPSYQHFSTVLAEYGFSVMMAWQLQGVIFARAATHPSLRPYLTGLPTHRLFSREVAFELATDAVADALEAFRSRVLIPGIWDPAKGASLKTFFIGQALYHFIRLFRRVWTAEKERLNYLPIEALASAPSLEPDPCDFVVEKDKLARAVGGLDSPMREILQLSAAGYEQSEIAELLQLTVKQVESRLYRHRKALGGGSA